jgi:formylglycine-generating enzyme required for sulfatase activity
MIRVKTDGFSRAMLGTREEGSIDCIALLPAVLRVERWHDSLRFSAPRGTKVIVWAGLPGYETRSAEFPAETRTISLREHLGMHEEKFVVQLFDGTELLDERVVFVPLATPRLISSVKPTAPSKGVPAGMVEIPAGTYTFRMSATDVPNPVIPYPDYSIPRTWHMERFLMDRYPVTNREFKRFLDATGYRPKDRTNFLRHWIGGRIPSGKENHPVVCVGLEDARAYARWAGKRLPTGMEWQYAAQGMDGRKYPWGNEFDSTRCNNALNTTTPVDAYPHGGSPFGVMDMVGNVWQLTNDVYDNGSYYYLTMRGGCYYYPKSSEWYVTGGAWPVDRHQMLLMVSPGFDRSETVGFRCVKD